MLALHLVCACSLAAGVTCAEPTKTRLSMHLGSEATTPVFEGQSELFDFYEIKIEEQKIECGKISPRCVNRYIDLNIRGLTVIIAGEHVQVLGLNQKTQGSDFAAKGGANSVVELKNNKLTLYEVDEAGERKEIKSATVSREHRVQIVFEKPRSN